MLFFSRAAIQLAPFVQFSQTLFDMLITSYSRCTLPRQVSQGRRRWCCCARGCILIKFFYIAVSRRETTTKVSRATGLQ